MKNNILLDNSIEILKKIREELHDDIDSSKRRQLDKAISELEENGDTLSHSQLLNSLGKALECLPLILKLINSLFEL